MRCLIIVGVLIFLVAAAAVGAENLVMNPSAEESAGNGIPKGWGRYVAAGGVRVAATADEKHSGESAACLELDKWDTPKDAQDAPENHSVSGAIILAENDGYRVDGALPCMPRREVRLFVLVQGDDPRGQGDCQRLAFRESGP
ncbi:MAG: hypothetical protein GX575_10805 [Candidatus Anammoximicrobium sp.]|nr:hypothetical protein [Candidatus Anammoximicrobium sp.]